MAMKATDTLALVKQRASLDQAKRSIAAHDPVHWLDVVDLMNELYRLCEYFGRDFAIYAALCVNETDWFRHKWWGERLNPASIGVTGVASQDAESPWFTDGKQGARLLFLLLDIKMLRDIRDGFGPWGAIAPAKVAQTLEYARSPSFPRVRTIQDLHARFGVNNQECVWACNPDNAKAICEKAAAMWPDLPDQQEGPPMPEQDVTFGLVPQPPILQLICEKPYEGAGFYRVAPRQNVGVCDHITDGRGSVEFYHSFFSTGGERAEDALVDFVVGRDGRIAMLNDWRGTRAPWANGNKLGMEGDGPAFYQAFGVAGIDQKLVSIEHEGHAGEEWTPAQWNASVNLLAWLFDQMGVRYDSYPVHQAYGVVTHMLHFEFTNKGGNGPEECPGSWYRSRIGSMQAQVQAVLMAHQLSAKPAPPTAPPPPVDTSAKPFAEFAHGLATQSDQHGAGHQLYEFLARRFKVAPGHRGQKRVSIGKDALIVEVLPEQTEIRSAFVARVKDPASGKLLDWIVDQEGYAYQANAFNPKLRLPLREQKQP